MRKVAMLVANDTFPEDPSILPLRFTQNDACELAEVLEDPETCGFDSRIYLNKTSQKILSDLEMISKELTQDDTLLFYYSGHGKLDDNELCLVSKETRTASLRATSIKASEVLGYLQRSIARRRILLLDCCHSGAIANIYKGGEAESALSGLAHSFGTYIVTASTAILFAEEREKDGHGIFTKALIDCLREPPKERITVDDWYDFAFKRLKDSGNQTPLKWGLQVQGSSIEIGDFRSRLARLAELERILDPPVALNTPKVPPGTSRGGKALFIPIILAIGVLILAAYFFFAPDNKRVLIELSATDARKVREVVYNIALMEACSIAYNSYTEPRVNDLSDDLPVNGNFTDFINSMILRRGPFDLNGAGKKYIYDQTSAKYPNEGRCGHYIFTNKQQESSAFSNMQLEVEQLATKRVSYLMNGGLLSKYDYHLFEDDAEFNQIVSNYQNDVIAIFIRAQTDTISINDLLPETSPPGFDHMNDVLMTTKVAPLVRALEGWMPEMARNPTKVTYDSKTVPRPPWRIGGRFRRGSLSDPSRHN